MTLEEFRNKARNDAMSNECESVEDRVWALHHEAEQHHPSLILDNAKLNLRLVALLAERVAALEAFLERQGLSIEAKDWS